MPCEVESKVIAVRGRCCMTWRYRAFGNGQEYYYYVVYLCRARCKYCWRVSCWGHAWCHTGRNKSRCSSKQSLLRRLLDPSACRWCHDGNGLWLCPSEGFTCGGLGWVLSWRKQGEGVISLCKSSSCKAWLKIRKSFVMGSRARTYA